MPPPSANAHHNRLVYNPCDQQGFFSPPLMSPLPITVLTSVFNGALYLDAAIESVLAQSFTDFEFLLIDDASTDATPALLAAWARRDSRIVLVRNPSNLGLTKSLNKGIRLARGEWIARQDADDISLPQRLEKQMAFLANHPEVGLLGTGSILIDSQGKIANQTLLNPTDHTEIKWQLLYDNPFYHTSTIFRRELGLQHPYDESLRFGQDFELWGRLLTATQGANLAAPLVYYRHHDNRISTIHYSQQIENALGVMRQRILSLVPDRPWSLQEIKAMRTLATSSWPTRGESVETALLLLKLFAAFAVGEGLNPKTLSDLQARLLDRLWRLARHLPLLRDQKTLLIAMWRYDKWQTLASLRRELKRFMVG
ncbi:MAG: glycosyltransferase [Magnetococcales bacterium]|nr:glycosyltransferase [Magnetococcales bacterium]MBF0437879.1 glycosyltransferase [Magnetococcales bacterium]